MVKVWLLKLNPAILHWVADPVDSQMLVCTVKSFKIKVLLLKINE